MGNVVFYIYGRAVAAGVGTLYVVDDDDNVHAHHVERASWTKWTLRHRAWSLSTSRPGDVLVTSRASRLLLEYSARGDLRLTVKLAADVVNPNHAVRLTGDVLVVCHGDMTDDVQRICAVDNRGQVLNACEVLAANCPCICTVFGVTR